ncbi:MAG: hypothetical protein QOI35_3814 [Cryptosporangiaceae bacterium]|nr:hypothetical protein [Cryptosporangiaceae bacterium]
MRIQNVTAQAGIRLAGRWKGRWKSPSVLAGILAGGIVFGIGVGLVGVTDGPGAALLTIAVLAVVVGVFVRPLLACALVFAAVAIGNRQLDNLAQGLQVIHLISALALIAVAFALLAGLPADRLSRPEARLPLLFGIAVIVVAAVSTALSVSPDKSIRMAATLAIGFLLTCAVVVTARTGHSLRILVGAAVTGSLFVTVPAILGAGQLSAVYGGSIVKHRPTGVAFTDPNELGSYAAIMAVLALGWILAARHRAERAAAAVAGAGAFLALALSLSRGAWFGTALGVGVIVILHPKARRPAGWIALGCVLAGALAVLVLPSKGVTTIIADRVTSVSDPSGNPYDVRPVTWREAIREFGHAPVVGNGPGSFLVLSGSSGSELQFYPRKHAHNGLLTVAAEMGSAGVLSVLGLVVTAMLAVRAKGRRLRVTRRWGDLGSLAGAAGAMAALLGHLTVDYPLRNPTLMITVWAVLGLLLAAVAMPADPQSGDGTMRTYAAIPRTPAYSPEIPVLTGPLLLGPADSYEILPDSYDILPDTYEILPDAGEDEETTALAIPTEDEPTTVFTVPSGPHRLSPGEDPTAIYRLPRTGLDVS